MPASSIRRSFMRAVAAQNAGIDVVRLDIGDLEFDLPEPFARGTIDALRAGKTHYSSMSGVPELRQAIAERLSTRYGIACSAEQVIVNQGATQGLNAAFTLCADQGDQVFLPEIYWPNYLQQTVLSRLNPIFYALDDGFCPSLPQLRKQLVQAVETGHVAAILLNSPGNPTGALFARPVVEGIYDAAYTAGCWVISDEAYCDYVYQGEHFPPLLLDWQKPESERRVLSVFSASKSYAATGLRLGWTLAPSAEIAHRLQLLNEPLTGSMTTPLQFGLAAAIAQDDPALRCADLARRCSLAAELLPSTGLEFNRPAGGLFFLLDISTTGLEADEFATRLLDEEAVAVVTGTGFALQPGAEPGTFAPTERSTRLIRVSFAVAEDRLREGISRLGSFVRKLQDAQQLRGEQLLTAEAGHPCAAH
jgi:aspartate aminotransferase